LAYDNTCKYLAEKYPAAFARWLLSTETTDIQVLKTELSLEPIRADSLAFLQVANQILHLEFQTSPYSEPPISFRMLDYWVRLKRLYWNADIVQVVIYLKSIDSELVFVDQFQNDNTSHRYRVIRMWEQDPAPLLANPVLLPLATLAQTDSPRALLQQVAEGVAMIEESSERSQLSTCIQLLAGLKFNQNLIRQLFRGEAMRESVIYQEILEEGRQLGRQQGVQQGVQQGKQQGVKEEALSLVSRQLIRRLGNIAPEIQQQISQLSLVQLEQLAEELLDFSQPTDLTNWLNQQPNS
jgi:predicted transposase/invertase (TIGR01784 family)